MYVFYAYMYFCKLSSSQRLGGHHWSQTISWIFFVVKENLMKNCLNKWKIETKILPKYNKNQNKLHLKEDVKKHKNKG